MTTRNETAKPEQKTSHSGAAKRRTGRSSGRSKLPVGPQSSDGGSTHELIRQIIENVAVPELLRRHRVSPPTRRSRSQKNRVCSVDLAHLVRLLKRTDRSAATSYIKSCVQSSSLTIEALMLDILPRAAELLEAEVASGRSSSAVGVVALSNLRMLALGHVENTPVAHTAKPLSGRVALLSMVDDAASFDLVPYEYALWIENYEIANLEGVTPKTLMDVLHATAFDCVMVGCRRKALAKPLSRWLRAARIVARGRPVFASIAEAGARRECRPMAGCSATVYGARDAVTFMSEMMVARNQAFDCANTAFQISDLTSYRSRSGHVSEYRRGARLVAHDGGPQPRVLTRH